MTQTSSTTDPGGTPAPQQQQIDIQSIMLRVSQLEARERQNRDTTPAPEIPAKASLSSVTSASSGGAGLNILSAAVVVQASTVALVAWTDYDASASCPDGAKFAWLEIEYFITQPDVGADKNAYVYGSTDHTTAIILMLARGQASGTADNNAQCCQVFCPLSSIRHFEYTIATNGFDGGCEVRLIGYVS